MCNPDEKNIFALQNIQFSPNRQQQIWFVALIFKGFSSHCGTILTSDKLHAEFKNRQNVHNKTK